MATNVGDSSSYELLNLQSDITNDTDSIAVLRVETTSQISTPNDILPHLTFPEGGLKAYSVVLGSFIGLVANFGTVNSVGAIQTYVATHQLEDVKASTVSWIFSIYMALSFGMGVIVGPYFDAKGATAPLIAGCVLQTIGYMSSAVCTEVWQFILAFSICIGFGNALCITPLIGAISHWFFLKRGRAIAMATIGGSIGGTFIPIMLRALYPKLGYPWAMRILGFFCLGCMIIAIVLVKDRIPPTTNGDDKDSQGKKKQLLGLSKELFDFSILKDMKFTFLVLGNFATELALLSIMTYYPTYAITQNMSESSSYILLTIFNASGVFGRLLPGYLSDIIGHFNVMILMLIGVILSIFLLWIPFGYNHGVLFAFAASCGFFSSSILSLTPVCLGVITPVNKFGQRYGLMYFFVCTANLFGIPLAAAIIGDGSKYKYTMFAAFCGIFTVVGTFCWYLSRYCIVKFKINVKI